MDGIRPILAICLSAQGKHELANEQLTEKSEGRRGCGSRYCLLAGFGLSASGPPGAGARVAAKRQSIWVMKTIAGLSRIQTGPICTTTRALWN